MSQWLYSPLDQFEVKSLISIKAPILGNFNLTLTNLGFYAIISIILITGLHILGNNINRLIPNQWSIIIESAYITVHNIVREQIGIKNEIYTPFIYAIIWFLLIINLNGNIPYSFTLTTSVISSLGLSVIIFIAVTILGIYHHGIHFFSYFVPSGTPIALVPALVLIELISYFARAVSLGTRLAANIIAGHILINILSLFLSKLFISGIIIAIVTLIPFSIFLGLIGLEIAVSFIQAYVFIVLVSSYIRDAIELH